MRHLFSAASATLIIASAPSLTHPALAAAAKCDKHLAELPVPVESIFARVTTVAVMPLGVGPQMSDSARRRGKMTIDSVVEKELQSSGFTIVSAATVDSIWKQVLDSIGPIFDPRTGQQDTVKLNAGRTTAVQRLQERYAANGFLYLQVRLVTAEFEQWTAKWDGTHQTFGNFGHHFMGSLLHDSYKGRTNALTLFTTLERPDGHLLFNGRGGLQVYVIPDNGKFLDVPDTAFFSDTARSANAARMALCPLLNHRRP